MRSIVRSCVSDFNFADLSTEAWVGLSDICIYSGTLDMVTNYRTLLSSFALDSSSVESRVLFGPLAPKELFKGFYIRAKSGPEVGEPGATASILMQIRLFDRRPLLTDAGVAGGFSLCSGDSTQFVPVEVLSGIDEEAAPSWHSYVDQYFPLNIYGGGKWRYIQIGLLRTNDLGALIGHFMFDVDWAAGDGFPLEE